METQNLFADLMLVRKGGDQEQGFGPTRLGPVATAQEWQAKAAALRELFRQTLGEMPDVDCPLDFRVESERDCGGHLERVVSYAVEPDERVTSVALIPKGLSAPAPVAFCVHPTGEVGKWQVVTGQKYVKDPHDLTGQRAYATQLVLRGYVAFAPDLLGSGDRIYPGRKPFDNVPLFEKHPRWSGTGKDVWDMQRALDALENIPEADAGRIASIGLSQGASVTTYLTAMDQRVKAGACICGIWPARISKNPFYISRTSWWIGRPALRPYFACGKDAPCDMHELLALAAPRPFLNITALNDFEYTLEEEAFTRAAWEDVERNVRRVYDLLGAPGQFRNVLHVNGQLFGPDMRALAYAFLDEVFAR